MSKPTYIIDSYITLFLQISSNYNNRTINVPNLLFITKSDKIDIKNLIVTFVYFAARKNSTGKLHKDLSSYYKNDINKNSSELGVINKETRITTSNESDKKRLINKINKGMEAMANKPDFIIKFRCANEEFKIAIPAIRKSTTEEFLNKYFVADSNLFEIRDIRKEKQEAERA